MWFSCNKIYEKSIHVLNIYVLCLLMQSPFSIANFIPANFFSPPWRWILLFPFRVLLSYSSSHLLYVLYIWTVVSQWHIWNILRLEIICIRFFNPRRSIPLPIHATGFADQFKKSHNAPILYPQYTTLEQKCGHANLFWVMGHVHCGISELSLYHDTLRWPPFCRRHFEINFLDANFTAIFPKCPVQNKPAFSFK